jgi:hypothetical protein
MPTHEGVCATAWRGWLTGLALWWRKAPLAFSRARPVRAVGPKEDLGRAVAPVGFGSHRRGSSTTQGRPRKHELASAAAARTLTRVTSADAASTSRCWPGVSAPEARRSRASPERRRLAGNGPAREVPAFARCARASVWLQKSAGDVRSRQDPLVAAGGSHGDLARGQRPEAKWRREVDPGGNTR